MKEVVVIDGKKPCPKCGLTKPIEKFLPDKSKKSGLSSYCRECQILLVTASHRKNPEACRVASAKYRRLWPERVAESQAKSESRPERKVSQIKWRTENIISVRLYVRNRKARTRISEGRITKEDIERIFAPQKGKCAICRKRLPRSYHIDHIKALSRGGRHEPRNIQLTCGPCNQTKHAQDPIDFMRKLGRLL